MNLTHEEVLNKMLYNNCPQDEDDRGRCVFVFEGHCVTYQIIAQKLGNGKYEILSFGIE